VSAAAKDLVAAAVASGDSTCFLDARHSPPPLPLDDAGCGGAVTRQGGGGAAKLHGTPT